MDGAGDVAGEHAFLESIIRDADDFIGPASFRQADAAQDEGVGLFSFGDVHFNFPAVFSDKDFPGEGHIVQGDGFSHPRVRKGPGHRIRNVFDDGKVFSNSQEIEHGASVDEFERGRTFSWNSLLAKWRQLKGEGRYAGRRTRCDLNTWSGLCWMQIKRGRSIFQRRPCYNRVRC